MASLKFSPILIKCNAAKMEFSSSKKCDQSDKKSISFVPRVISAAIISAEHIRGNFSIYDTF